MTRPPLPTGATLRALMSCVPPIMAGVIGQMAILLDRPRENWTDEEREWWKTSSKAIAEFILLDN